MIEHNKKKMLLMGIIPNILTFKFWDFWVFTSSIFTWLYWDAYIKKFLYLIIFVFSI